MTLIITKSINPDDQQELFAGLRQYNQQYLDAAQFGDLGIYSRDAQGVMQGGLIAKRKGNWLCIEYLWVKILGQPTTGIGIIDDVVALHTRPCFYGDTYWRNKNNCEKAITEICTLAEKHDIDLNDLIVHGGIERDKFDYDNLGAEDKFFPANCKILKELISSVREKRCRTFI